MHHRELQGFVERAFQIDEMMRQLQFCGHLLNGDGLSFRIFCRNNASYLRTTAQRGEDRYFSLLALFYMQKAYDLFNQSELRAGGIDDVATLFRTHNLD